MTERHGLEKGDIVEIQRLSRIPASQFATRIETKTLFARFLHTRVDGRKVFDQGEGMPVLSLSPDRIRSIRKVTPEYVVTQFYVGQPVIVRKYGGDYNARVLERHRSRITVGFITRGGENKTLTLPAWRVRAIS